MSNASEFSIIALIVKYASEVIYPRYLIAMMKIRVPSFDEVLNLTEIEKT